MKKQLQLLEQSKNQSQSPNLLHAAKNQQSTKQSKNFNPSLGKQPMSLDFYEKNLTDIKDILISSARDEQIQYKQRDNKHRKQAQQFQKQQGSKPMILSKAGEYDTSLIDMSRDDGDFIRTQGNMTKLQMLKCELIDEEKQINGYTVQCKKEKDQTGTSSNCRNLIQQSRNQNLEQRYSEMNTTQQMAYTLNNNSFNQEEPLLQLFPLQSLDNNQMHSPQQQIFQFFSPSKLLANNKIDKRNTQNFMEFKKSFQKNSKTQREEVNDNGEELIIINDQTHKNSEKIYRNHLDAPIIQSVQQSKKILVIDTIENPETIAHLQENLNSKLYKNETDDFYMSTDRQGGPLLKNDLVRDVLRQSKNEFSSAAQLSEIQSQGDLLQPNSLSSLKQSQILTKKNSPHRRPASQNKERSSFKKKHNLLRNESNNSSEFEENAGVTSGYEKNYQQKRFLKKGEDYDSQKPSSEQQKQDRLQAVSSMDSQYDLVTLQNIQPFTKNKNVLLELNLRLVNMKDVDPQLFKSNRYLKYIDLRNNRLKEIPEEIGQLQNLWKLRIDYNYLTQLPKSLSQLARLEYFSASQNKLTYLPDNLFHASSQISILILNDNKLRDLQNSINHLQNLNVLLLHNNHLTELPFSLCNLKEIAEFSLDWLAYKDIIKTSNRHLKGTNARQTITDFQMFLRAFQLVAQLNKLPIDKVHFTHFLMYFHRLTIASDIQNILYTQKRRTIFHLMALNGQTYLFQDIIENFSDLYLDINKTDSDESTPFVLAIRNKRKEFVKYLLTLPLTNINRPSQKYGHPLHLAIKSHEFKLALRLLKGCQMIHQRHLDVNNVSEDGNNSMHYLFSNFYIQPEICTEIAKQLIKRGININLKNKNGYSPLQIAIIGGQNAALQFAIDFNKAQRKNEKDTQIFNFNQKGGKLNQNCLYLSIQQNNIRVISTILNSDEVMDFLAVDDEGRFPKDICPYNSPVYKLLCQYEKRIHRKLYDLIQSESHNADSNGQYQETKPEVVQYFLNKRNYESPQKIRKKILEKAQQQQDKTAKKRKSFIRGKSQINANKLNENDNFQQSKNNNESKQGHHRLFSANQKGSTDKINLVQDLESSEDEQEDDNMNFNGNSPNSGGLMSVNFSMVSSRQKQQVKPSITPLMQKELSIDVLMKAESKYEFQIPTISSKAQLQRKGSITSSDESQASKTVDIGMRDSDELKTHRDNDYGFTIQYQQVTQSTKQRVFASKNKIQNIKDKQESIVKEKFEDDEDDANVPEEEGSGENELQKPQTRLFTKSPSQKAFFLNENFQDPDMILLAKNILDEVSKSQIKYQPHHLSNINHLQLHGYPTIPTQEMINMTSQVQLQNQSMSAFPEYNVQLSDASYIYQVQDDSIGIQAPFDPSKNIKIGVGLLKSANHKFNDITQIPVKNDYQIYEEFYYLLASSNYTQCMQFLLANIENGIILSRYFIDFVYILSLQLKIKMIQQLMFEKPEADQNEKRISKNLYELFMFELINNHEVKIYDSLQKYSCVTLRPSSKQTMILDQKSSEKMKTVYVDGPILKVQLKKSPSLVINENIEFKQQEVATNRSNASQSHNKDVGSTTQSINKGLTPKPPLFDIKQMIQGRKSLDFEKNSKTQQSNKGQEFLKQIKKPLFDREQERMKESNDSFSRKTSLVNNSSQNISKKNSVTQFQQNYQALFKNSTTQMTQNKVFSIHALNSNSYRKIQQKGAGQKIVMIEKNKKHLKQLDIKKTPVNDNRNKSAFSQNKVKKYLATPANRKNTATAIKQIDSRMKLVDYQINSQRDSNYYKLANFSAPGKQRKSNNSNIQSRNSSNKIFMTDESMGRNSVKHSQQKEEDIYTETKFQLSEKVKRRDQQINPVFRDSKLQIQLFSQDEDADFCHETLRLREHLDVLKDSHINKMDKVHESAIKRKQMFSSHNYPFDQKKSITSQSIDKNKYNSSKNKIQNQVDNNITDSSDSHLEKKIKSLYRNSEQHKPKPSNVESQLAQALTTKNQTTRTMPYQQDKLWNRNTNMTSKNKNNNMLYGNDDL